MFHIAPMLEWILISGAVPNRLKGVCGPLIMFWVKDRFLIMRLKLVNPVSEVW